MNRCGLALLSVPIAAALTAVAPVVAGPAAQAADCPDVDVSFARGTNDAPGLGDVGNAFARALTARLPDKAVDIYAVDYPANLDFVLRHATGLPVSIADDALSCVALGTGRCLEDIKAHRHVLINMY